MSDTRRELQVEEPRYCSRGYWRSTERQPRPWQQNRSIGQREDNGKKSISPGALCTVFVASQRGQWLPVELACEQLSTAACATSMQGFQEQQGCVELCEAVPTMLLMASLHALSAGSFSPDHVLGNCTRKAKHHRLHSRCRLQPRINILSALPRAEHVKGMLPRLRALPAFHQESVAGSNRDSGHHEQPNCREPETCTAGNNAFTVRVSILAMSLIQSTSTNVRGLILQEAHARHPRTALLLVASRLQRPGYLLAILPPCLARAHNTPHRCDSSTLSDAH